jgi:Cu2+-exporting ATPase
MEKPDSHTAHSGHAAHHQPIVQPADSHTHTSPDQPTDEVKPESPPSHHAQASHAHLDYPNPVMAETISHVSHEQVQQAEPVAGAHRAHTDHTGHERLFRNRFLVCLVLSLPVLLYSPMIQEWLGFRMPAFPGSAWIVPTFSVVIFLYGGLPFLSMAVPELRDRKPGMMTLITLAISVAFIYSLATTLLNTGENFYWELVTLIDVMLLGHWLEMRSVRQASGALNELARLMPDTTERITTQGGVETIPVSRLIVGDLVLVRPGASLPADGVVEEGESQVNEAMLTGESKSVKKSPGENVIAGTLNGEGSLRVRVNATGEQTALAGIMRLVAQAQQSRSRTQVLADKAAGWLFYTALIVAGLTAVGWIAATGLGFQTVERVVTVLVIACPHALGLAIPLVVAITTSIGASNGILVRDRLALEIVREIDVVIFDKTGTLTKGEQGVVALAAADGQDEREALALAAAVEGDSEHIIARAIRQAAQERHLSLPVVDSFTAIKGRGVHATYLGGPVYVGSPGLLDFLGLELPADLVGFTREGEKKGQTVVYLVKDGRVGAAFALSDVIRPESRLAVERLHQMDIEVVLLTGDSQAVALAVAKDLNIDHFYAEVLPEDKDKKVIELQRQGKHVAMVGDGVNDAPALARADVGIAIGSGTDVAVESAGIILVKNNPLDVVKAIDLSRASYRKMIQNLAWATGYNVIALPLAAGILAPWGVLLSPAVGALFMSLSTVIVAINAQLLRRTRLFA